MLWSTNKIVVFLQIFILSSCQYYGGGPYYNRYYGYYQQIDPELAKIGRCNEMLTYGQIGNDTFYRDAINANANKSYFVSVGVYFSSVEYVENGKDDNVKTSAQISVSWMDWKLAVCFMAANQSAITMSNYSINQIMEYPYRYQRPDVSFTQESGGAGYYGGGDDIKVSTDGIVSMTYTRQITSPCTADISKFPFDKQSCLITLNSQAAKFGFRWTSLDYDPSYADSDEYTLSDLDYTSDDAQQKWFKNAAKRPGALLRPPVLFAQLQFTRKRSFKMELFTGPAFVVLLSFVAFFATPKLQDSASLSGGLFLGLMLYCVIIYRAIPEVMNSTVVLNYFAACLGIMFIQSWILALTAFEFVPAALASLSSAILSKLVAAVSNARTRHKSEDRCKFVNQTDAEVQAASTEADVGGQQLDADGNRVVLGDKLKSRDGSGKAGSLQNAQEDPLLIRFTLFGFFLIFFLIFLFFYFVSVM